MNDLAPLSTQASTITEVRHYVENALSDNTRRAYRSDIEHFQAWGGIIPATPEQIAAYISTYAGALSIATLQRRLVSISKVHAVQGYADPAKTVLVKMVLRGIRREHGVPQTQVLPILKEDLTVMLSHVPDTLKGARDKALLLLGFCGAFRRSELSALRCTDLEFSLQGLTVTLPRSKTDQYGQGRKVGIPKGRGRICPVASVGFWLKSALIDAGYVFRSVTKGERISSERLSDRAVAEIVKAYAERAGLDPTRYSGHSLRSGLCTSAAQNGASSWKIRAQTGHKSDAMLARYIRDGDLFSDNAAALF